MVGVGWVQLLLLLLFKGRRAATAGPSLLLQRLITFANGRVEEVFLGDFLATFSHGSNFWPDE